MRDRSDRECFMFGRRFLFKIPDCLFRKILFVLCFITAVPSALLGQLGSITVSPGNTAVGTASIHTIALTTTRSIPADGQIVFNYPSGFDVSTVSIVSSSTLDGTFSVTHAGDSVTVTRSGGTPSTAGNSETFRLANVTNHATANNYQITVRTKDSGGNILDSGTSAFFTIYPGPLDKFSVTKTAGNETAGSAFQITITAQDAYNNTVTSFLSSATLTDLTGTLSPGQTTNFTSGTWNGNVTITKTHAADRITATYSGKAGTSATFVVNPAILHHFEFGIISSPQTAGAGFSITITAVDGYSNTKSDYTSPVVLSEKTGTLVVQSTGTSTTPAFVSGMWSGNVRITQATLDNQIVATGGGQSGTSGYFNVNAAGVDHFILSSISTQSAGQPFLIKITAQDVYNNTATGFTNTVTINDGTGTITPNTSGNFTNGIWTGNVIISQIRTGNQITVNDGSGHTGSSNTFNIVSSSVDHFVISSISSPQIAGSGFGVTVTAQDANNNTVTSFTGTANITDETGTITPQQIIFSAGTWAGNVTITQSRSNDFITVTGVGKSSPSNTFAVNPAGVNHFDVGMVNSPQTAGTAFNIALTAKDTYGNTVTTFNGTVNITDGTGTITPTVSGNFNSGVRTQSVSVRQAQNDVSITVNDGSGHVGSSNFFNVIHGALHHFHIDNIATQATGLPFAMTVTAQDANNNTVTSFHGPGNTVNIVHSGTGAISPAASGDFIHGIRIENVTIAQTQTNDRITVTRSGGSETGLSNTFDVTPSSVDHFVVSSISSPQTTGIGFSVTITAEDANNNRVTNFNGTANIIDETGTSSPRQVPFNSGRWTGSIAIIKSSSGNVLTVTGVGKSGTSNEFNVIPAPVQSFEIGLIASPQSAGSPFAVVMTAKDSYGNTATSFNGTVTISDGTGTITPSLSGNFSSGTRTETVTIIRAQNDVTVTVNDGSGHTGTSNLFNVIPGNVHHFVIGTIGNQIAGDPFSITVRAEDSSNNVAISFTGTVNISDGTGTLTPTRSGNFFSGQWSGGVTITQSATGNRITVIRTGGTESGQSNLFNLSEPPGIRITAVTPSQSTITAGQAEDWTISIAVQNLSSSFATLDSLRLKFLLAGMEQTDYQLILPTTFKISGSNILNGSSTDTLEVVVNRSGVGIGNIHVQTKTYCLDNNTGRSVLAEGSTGITVQDSARLEILEVRPSQNEVTKGQESPWTVTVVLRNFGGSEVTMDSSAASTTLSFGLGTSWQIEHPSALYGGGWHLGGGKTDSLLFGVERTGDGQVGLCTIHAFAVGLERNTGRRIAIDTRGGRWGEVSIVDSAFLRIAQVQNLAMNAPYVNTEQNFTIRVTVENRGGERAHDVQVFLRSTGWSDFPLATSIAPIEGGKTVSADISGFASAIATSSDRIIVHAVGIAEHTNNALLSEEDTLEVVVQNPAELIVDRVRTSRAVVTGDQVDPWSVKVAVRNEGQAVLVLDKPEPSDITFWAAGIPTPQPDYTVVPDTVLMGGGLTLAGGVGDTLRYVVEKTGGLGGDIRVKAEVSGKDQNTAISQSDSGSTIIVVHSNPAFRIISTRIKTLHTTEAGNGYVNTGQGFQVMVLVENGLGETVRDIRVRLESNGGSLLAPPTEQISRLIPTESDSVLFQVIAENRENLVGELFTATLAQAVRENSEFPAPIGPALDSTAVVFIQTPAHLSLSLDLSNPDGIFSDNQLFTLKAFLNNSGTGEVDNSGRVRITLPLPYTLGPGSVDTVSISPVSGAQWTIRAPSSEQSARTIQVELYRLPKEKNTGESADVQSRVASIQVTTIKSSLLATLLVSSPDGARDQFLSTEQNFVVKAIFQYTSVNNITAEIFLPNGYTTEDDREKSVATTEVSWQITAPSVPMGPRNIQLLSHGFDALQPEREIVGNVANISVVTVLRADLSLNLSIISPPDATDGSVSLGQEFVVGAVLENSGTASTTGTATVSLSTLPNGYSTNDPYQKNLVNGEASWTIKAPIQPSSQAVSIEASLISVPLDENTNREAHVKQRVDKVAVTTVGTWLAVSSFERPDSLSGLVVAGQNGVWLMALALTNRGEVGANRIVIHALSFEMEDFDGNEIAPKDVLSKIRAVRMFSTKDTTYFDKNHIFGETSPEGNPFTMAFSLKDTVPATDTSYIAIFGDITENIGETYFRLNIPSGDYIDARDIYSPDIDIAVLNSSGNPLEDLTSYPKKVISSQVAELDSKPYLLNFPNPFGEPGKENTKIVYYLKEDTDVQFRIYTLTGELVWSRSFADSDPQGSQGLHSTEQNSWVWDGKNDRGRTVLNGVYILVMKTDYGDVAKTKIAFIK